MSGVIVEGLSTGSWIDVLDEVKSFVRENLQELCVELGRREFCHRAGFDAEKDTPLYMTAVRMSEFAGTQDYNFPRHLIEAEAVRLIATTESSLSRFQATFPTTRSSSSLTEWLRSSGQSRYTPKPQVLAERS